ncbi:GtrA family protein [Methylocapsa acidiphila]|uniref:GtrA family protein n=1 Tax=Methylocapsa acidiphila TaxID=133552 RepID=UPI000414682C|nr:GtrA family protein [Methylocapsa acidiphila]
MTALLRQFSSFAGVGFIATAVHYCVLIGLVQFAGLGPVVAALAGYSAGGAVSYGLSRRCVFHSARPHDEAAWRFAVVVSVGFGLTYLLMSLFVSVAGFPYLPAQVVTTGAVMLWNFAAHRVWTFAGPSASRWR